MRLDLDLSQPDLMARDPQPYSQPPRVAQAVMSLFEECGFEVADFLIEEETKSDLSRLLGVVGGLLRVQCRSTGEDRLYSTGSSSAWMASVLADLDDGHFAGAQRQSDAIVTWRRSSALARSTASESAAQGAAQEFTDTAPDVRLPIFEPPLAPRRWGFARPADAAYQQPARAGLGSF